jgi:FAD-dependent urate hydroxylase
MGSSSLETVLKLRLRRFWGSLELLFESQFEVNMLCADIDLKLGFEKKLKRTPKSTEAKFKNSLLETNYCQTARLWRRSAYVFLCSLVLLPLSLYSLLFQDEVWRDLEAQGLSRASIDVSRSDILDVAIIGGGQSGLCLCLALWKRGIFHVQIFDKASAGVEGPWLTTARMQTLRSGKNLPGPALDIPHLLFRSWYEAKYGEWESLGKIPTPIWADYLQWYREVLHLPVQNEWHLLSIQPKDDLLELHFDKERKILARKVVLATGRGGSGGFEIPAFIKELPKPFWYHTGEVIDYASFSGKRICVVGAGASSADIAAIALENGAESVLMFMRKVKLPKPGLFAEFKYWHDFYSRSDEEKACCFQAAVNNGISIPYESLKRLKPWTNFSLLSGITIEKISADSQLHIETNKGCFEADLLIAATGYTVDLSALQELAFFHDHILLWQDRIIGLSMKLGRFPYLGPHFEFMEKTPGDAPLLKQVYCFNYGAFFSHGRMVGDIDQLPFGINRLAEGILQDLLPHLQQNGSPLPDLP